MMDAIWAQACEYKLTRISQVNFGVGPFES